MGEILWRKRHVGVVPVRGIQRIVWTRTNEFYECWMMARVRNVRENLLIDRLCTTLYIPLTFTEALVKLSISEARKRLPALVRRVQRDAGTSVQITVHDQVVAELRAVQREPEPGAAATALLEIMARLPKRRGGKTRISSRVKTHLYGRRGVLR